MSRQGAWEKRFHSSARMAPMGTARPMPPKLPRNQFPERTITTIAAIPIGPKPRNCAARRSSGASVPGSRTCSGDFDPSLVMRRSHQGCPHGERGAVAELLLAGFSEHHRLVELALWALDMFLNGDRLAALVESDYSSAGGAIWCGGIAGILVIVVPVVNDLECFLAIAEQRVRLTVGFAIISFGKWLAIRASARGAPLDDVRARRLCFCCDRLIFRRHCRIGERGFADIELPGSRPRIRLCRFILGKGQNANEYDSK